MIRCRHAKKSCRTVVYRPIAARRQNLRAHGGACDVEICQKCFARRLTNYNAGQSETTGWLPAALS